MDPGRVDAEVNTAPAPETPARPPPDAVPSVEPLHGPMDTAEGLLGWPPDGLWGPVGEENGLSASACEEEEKKKRARRMLEKEQTKERSKGKTRRISLPSKAHQALLTSKHHPLP